MRALALRIVENPLKRIHFVRVELLESSTLSARYITRKASFKYGYVTDTTRTVRES